MGGAAWGGHTGCPGDLRKNRRQAILNAAGAKPVPTPKPSPSEEVRMFLARSTTDSAHDPQIKKGLAYVVTDGGLVSVATADDMANMTKRLGPEVALTGNQLWGFNQTR